MIISIILGYLIFGIGIIWTIRSMSHDFSEGLKNDPMLILPIIFLWPIRLMGLLIVWLCEFLEKLTR